MTKYSFTGQYSYMDDITTENVTEGFGLMYYREASRRDNARMYDPALGRFTSADTIIPPMQGVQAWDRYAYVNNSPVMYTDPTGHVCVNNGGTDDEVAMPGNCGGGGGGGSSTQPPASSPQVGDDIYQDSGKTSLQANSPVIREFENVIIITMPPGSSPAISRTERLQRLGIAMGIAGFLFDIGEMIGIFVPGPDEDFTAVWDIGVTYASSLLSGESYIFETPHPDVPKMVSVNQDVLVTAGDAFIASGAKTIGTLVGSATGTPLGAKVGNGVGLGTDVVTTGASIVYDYSRVFGSTPNYITAGVSVIDI